MKKLNVIVFLLACTVGSLNAAEIKICTDQNFWYPFTFVKDKKAEGLHVKIVKQALASTDYKVSFTPLPWQRCLSAAKSGRYDAVVSASYKDKRAEFLNYPDDAKTSKKSSSRISQVEYVVVSSIMDSFEFNGDLKTLPNPVRATKGYSIVEDLSDAGIKVDTAKSDILSLRKLIRDNKGVVITLPETVRFLSKQARYKNKFKIHAIPVKSKSYYMPFSKLSSISEKDQLAIWQKIAEVRDDELVISTYLNKLSSDQ